MKTTYVQLRSDGRGRAVIGLLACLGLAAGSMGFSCDSDASQEFRETATPAIGNGVKTIVNGVLDGLIDAIANAGDSGNPSGSSQ